jgi:uncharacterized membrane protein YfcA
VTLWLYPILFAAGLAAGFVDSIAGGGGLITLPVLLNLGVPPMEALGTNKLQATFGSGGATWNYGRAGLIDFKECAAGVAWTFAGALAGSLLVRSLDPALLRKLIPWLLIAIALYTLLRPQFGGADLRPMLGRAVFYPLVGLGIGFYDGFFGPGTGSFWAVAFVLGLGFNLTRATAHTKLMNFASNAASLLVFLLCRKVLFGPGLTMGLGQWLGARLGARLVVRRGTKFIRPVFVSIVLAISARLLYENFAAR